MTETIVNPGAAFEQRPDNKLWIFYEKSGGLRLRKVYVFAYTWYDARNGALTALAPLKSKDVEGSEVDLPEDILIDTGSMLVFTDKSGRFEVLETLQRMSGKEASRLCVLPKPDALPAESDALVKSPAEDSELLNSIREKLEQTKPVPRREPGSVLSEESFAVSPTTEVPKGGDPAYSGTSPASDETISDSDEDRQASNPGEAGVDGGSEGDGESVELESCSPEISLRQMQTTLPWTIRYSRDFRANPQTHKDFAHALVHVIKATGKLSALVDDMDHDREIADDPTLRDRYAKYVADLVVCALRIANEFPGGHIDLQNAVVDRIESKNVVERKT